MTARTLITRALKLIGVAAEGVTPTAEELNDGLDTLNELLASLNSQGLPIYTDYRGEIAFVASQAYYTVGASGSADLNHARPSRLLSAMVELTSPSPDIEIPLEVLTDEQYNAITVKDLESALPTKVYFKPDYPLAKVYVWPIVNAVADKLILYFREPLGTLAALETALAYPEGYERMLRYNLALDLSPEFSRPVDPDVRATAVNTLAVLKQSNHAPLLLRVDDALLVSTNRGGSNIKTGSV
jgi:hypothetical protein